MFGIKFHSLNEMIIFWINEPFFLIFKGLGFTSYIEEVRSVLQECKTQAAVSELNLCIVSLGRLVPLGRLRYCDLNPFIPQVDKGVVTCIHSCPWVDRVIVTLTLFISLGRQKHCYSFTPLGSTMRVKCFVQEHNTVIQPEPCNL